MVSRLPPDAQPGLDRSIRPGRLQPYIHLVVPFCAVVGVIVDLIVWNHGRNHRDSFILAVSVTLVGTVIALAVLLIGVAGRLVRRLLFQRGGTPPGRRFAAAAVTLGAALAAPVQLGWMDGCNEHFATVALIAVPHVLAAEPESTTSYEDNVSLVKCDAPRIPTNS